MRSYNGGILESEMSDMTVGGRLIGKLVDLGVPESTARHILDGLDFIDYVEFMHSIDTNDLERAKQIVGHDFLKIEEADNAYATTAPSVTRPTSSNSATPKTDFKIGDDIKYGDSSEEGEIVDPKIVDNKIKVKDKHTLDVDMVDSGKVSMQDDIQRLKHLAGIEEDGATAVGGITNSGAIAGACLSTKKIAKMTKPNSKKKPGPKTK
jgi:hypothetical protein